LLSIRFKAANLEALYQEVVSYAWQHCLDAQTFIHLIVLFMRRDQLPPAWRFFAFSDFNRLTMEHAARPIG
jgi:hypothetical protein